jgi:exodeoxyribonuclease VII small subunit
MNPNSWKRCDMSDTPSEALTFEQSLAHLEELVRDLEDSQLGLDESLARYEQGVRLIRECQARLQTAEQRILLVTGVEEGQPVLQPFRHEASAPARVPPAPKPRRRGADTDTF